MLCPSSPAYPRLLLALLVAVTLPVLATPPAAPSEFTVLLTKTSQSPGFPHTYVFLWTDNASDENGFEIDYRIGTTGSFSPLINGIAANTTGQLLNLVALADGTTIQFQVRAYKGTPTPTEFSAASNISTLTIPATTFNTPANLSATPVSSTVEKVTWTDVSTSEDGVELWMAQQPGGAFFKLGDIYFYQAQEINVTALTAGAGYEFKVRAFREGTPRTYTPFSSPSPPAAPTGLAASAQGSTSLTLSWTDNSSLETSYEILTRPAGAGAFTVHQVAAADATTAEVTNLTPGVSLDFAVRARADYSATPTFSANSNIVTRLMHDVINSPHYAQGLVGQPFSYALTTTSGSALVSRSVSGLPAGLSFDSGTGLVTGTPSAAGATLATMTATFADGSSDSPGLAIRVLSPPAVGSVIPAQTLSTGTPLTVPLGSAFTDPEGSTAVKVTTTLGTMNFLLFDGATPQTVANFMHYVGIGAYTNNLFHRSKAHFVVQAGAYKPGAPPNGFLAIPKFSPVPNEPGLSNLRGTIAMAKLPGDPDSATEEFFINLENNSGNLDFQNGGFTVFGRVIDSGMTVADAIGARPVGDYSVVVDAASGTLADWPLDSPSALAAMDNTKVLGITSVTPLSVFSYAVTANSNAGAVTAAISGGNLILTPVAPGTANITLRATNLEGLAVSQTFAVTTRSGVATLSKLVPSSGTLSPAFSSGTLNYAATVPNTTASLTLTPTVSQAQTTVEVNGVAVASGAASGAIPLLVGPNSITVLGRAEDGVTTKTYTLTVTRAAASPVVSTQAVTVVGATGATLNGTVDAKGASTTTSFDYGTTTAYGSNIAATPTPVTGTGAAAVSAAPGGLNPGTTYHYRARGTSAAGTALGADMTFTTKSTVATLSNLVLSAGTLSPAFSGATTVYAATVANGTASFTVTPTTTQAQATVQVNGTLVPSGKPSGAIALAPGANTITLLVTAPDGVTTKSHTVTVTRAQPPSATTLAATSIGATTATFNGVVNAGGGSTTVTFDYGPTASYGSTITAAPTPVNGTAATNVSAARTGLTPGTTYHYRVKGVNLAGTALGDDATFTTPSNVATLSALALSSGSLSPAFASATTAYTTTVSSATSSLTLTPTAANAGAKVTVNGVIVPSGIPSGAIALSPGLNTITVQVTAQDGVTAKAYTVAVTRTAPPEATTLAQTNLTAVSAKLNGVINAMGANTAASFKYGTTPAYGSTVAAAPAAVTGGASVPVSAAVTGLLPGTTYHFSAKGISTGGTSPDMDMTFATPSNVATLSGLSLGSGTLSPTFAAATVAYTATVPNATDTLTVTPTLTSNAASVTVNGVPVPSGTASAPVNLSVGSNAISVVATAQDGTTKKTYTVTVTRTAVLPTATTAGTTGVTATGAVVSGSITAKNANTAATFDYGPTVAYGKSMTATPSPVAGNSPTTVSAALAGLTPGSTYHYRLRGANLAGTALGTDATFSTPSNVATLSGLVLSSGALSPVFTGATTSYAQTVPNATASLTVKPTAAHAAATILLNGGSIVSGATSGAIPLNTGANVVTVQVTAQDGVATKTYTVTVTRSPLPVTTTLAASNVKTTGATLNATVNAGGLNTAASFEYGPTASYGTTVAAVPATITGSANTAVSATIAGLTLGTTYHFRIKGTSSGGTATGTDGTFTTQSANLAGLAISAGTLTPVFASNTLSYTTSVPYATTSLTVTPTATDSATIKVNGGTVASGSASAPLPLVPGSNTIGVALTSQDGAITKTYTVTVTRADAPPGALDLALNGTGKTTTALGGTLFGGGNDSANCVLVQGDGKIVAAGTTNDNGQQLFAVVRYNADGSLDPSFNGNGKVTTDFGSSNFAYAMTLQNDGKIVVVGEALGSVALARYNPNGSLDSTFNGIGKVLITDTGYKSGRGVVVQSSGKIVVAVEFADGSNRHWLGLLRCNANGTLDTTFGGTGTGKITVPTALPFTGHWFDSYTRGVAVQSDGKIILAGYGVQQFTSGQTYDIELTRFTVDGIWDGTFNGGNGVVSTDFGSTDDRGLGVAVQSDDKIVVAGMTDGNFALVRYTSAGALDPGFNSTGAATADFGGANDSASSVALQSNGKIVLAGWTDNGGSYDFALARFSSGGILDTSFNGTGRLVTSIGPGSDFGAAVALQPDGKIVVAGSTNNGSDSDFALARFQGDPRFGIVTAPATVVTTTGATLNGLVSPNGLSTTVSFDYGLTTAYGTNVAATPASVTGSPLTVVSKVLAGLVPGATYHYRAKGVSSGGTALGADTTFTTPSNLATLSALTLSSGTLSPAFASGTTAYTASVSSAVTSLSLTAIAGNANATVTINGQSAASGSPGSAIALSPGLNPITVQVTAQDGTTTKTYTVGVTRTTPPLVTTLAQTNLTAKGAKLNATVNARNLGTTVTFEYGPTTAYGSTVAATPSPVAGGTDAAVSATLATLTPSTVYHFRAKGVSAGGTTFGADATFTTPSNVATLSSLALSEGVLSPVFSSATTNYAATLANAVSLITIIPAPTNAGAAMKVNGVTVTAGSGGASFALAVGANTINVVTTAQDGTTKTYTIVVTRAPALASLTTQPATGIGTTTATLNGLVNTANNTSTAVSFDFGLTTAYGSTVTAAPSPVLGSAATKVKVTPVGLAPGTTYHFRVKGVNAAGTTTSSGDLTFTTLSTTATLSGLALSSGSLSPAFAGATTTYTATVPAATSTLTVTPTVTNANASVAVNSVLVPSGTASGPVALSPGTNTITVQVTAQDGVTVRTYTVTVTRLASPAVATLAAGNVTATGARLNGTVNALNSATTTSFVYGLTTAYGSSAAGTPSPVTGDAVTGVSATIAGLQPGTTYHYQIKGASPGGTSLGGDATFTTPDNVASLSGLALSTGTPSPIFASATTTYTATVSNATTSVAVTPTLTRATATVKVNGVTVTSGGPSGAINLNVGANTITVVGTAQDGTTTKSYTLTVTRAALAPTMTTLAASGVSATGATLNGTANANNAASTLSFDFGLTVAYGSSATATPSPLSNNTTTSVSAVLNGLLPGSTYHYRARGANLGGTGLGTDATFSTPSNVATLSGLVLSTGALNPAFTASTTNYNQTVPGATASLTVKPTATSGAAGLLLNGTPIASGATSGAIALSPGLNTITVQVTAQDGVTTTYYTLNVSRPTPAPTVVTQQADQVTATAATVHGTANAQGASTTVKFDYGLTTAYGSGATAAESPVGGSSATPVTAALTGLQAGATYHYRLSAQNAGGLTSGLDATFTTPSNLTTLSNLTLSTGALTPAFNSGTTSYTHTVPNTTTSLTVTPVAAHAAATLLLNGVTINSGSTSGPLALSPGPNTITVQVTAQDGITTGVYTIDVTRTTPAPTVATQPADNVGVTGATLHGSVNAEGTSTSVTFEYGPTTAYGSSVAAAPSPLTGSSATPVSADLTGLQPGTTYHYRVRALNAGGTSTGDDATFTTPSNVATLSSLVFSTGALSPVFASSTTSYTQTVPHTTESLTVTPTATHAAASLLLNGAAISSGSTSDAIALSTGLNTITVQVTAQDGVTVTSYAVGVTRLAPPPEAVTQSADNLTTTGATLHGTVNAHGASTTVSFEYGLTTAYGSSATAAESPLSDNSTTPVSAALTGLLPGTTYHYRAKAENERGVSLGLDATFTATHADVLATLTPASTSSDSTSPVVLQVTGLVAGESIVVERFVDANADGLVDAGEFLAERFTVTDGMVASIGGVRNNHVPGDEDGAADTQVDIHLSPAQGPELGRLAGLQIVRISSPTAAFPSLTRPLSITHPAQSQSISGTVSDGTDPVPFASVVLLDAANNSEFALGVLADATGHFTVNAPVGSYNMFAVRNGYVAGLDPVALGSGEALTHDLLVTAATTSISGTVADAGTSSGLGGVQLVIKTAGGLITILSTNANGTYAAPVTAAQWQLKSSEISLSRLGQLSLGGDTDASADTTGSAKTGVDISLPKVTALIHGTVANSAATPLADIRVGVNDNSHTYGSETLTDADGHYVLGVAAGAWNAHLASENPALAGFVIPDSQSVSIAGAQAVPANFTVRAVTATISGTVKDGQDNPVVGVRVSGSATASGESYSVSTVTSAGGAYALPVFSGTWDVSVSGDDLLAQGYQAPPNQGANATTGTVTLDFSVGLSSNANLTSLVLSSGALSPVFASDTTDYTVMVDNATAAITVTPTLSSHVATVTVNAVAVTSGATSAPINLTAGPNTITLVATAQDNTTKTYTLAVTRAQPPPAMAPLTFGPPPSGESPPAAESTPATKARLVSPAAGSTLTSETATFQWDAGSGASEYRLSVGSSAGGSDIYSASQGSALTRIVTDLPRDGRAFYVTLGSSIDGAWQEDTYAFISWTQSAPLKARLTGPAPNGGALPGANVSFTWDAGRGATEYWLSVGRTVQGTDLFDGSQGTGRSRTVTVPTDGSELYVTLKSKINGAWLANNYVFATTDPTVKAVLSAPADQSTLPAAETAFSWNEVAGADEYWLSIGSTEGGTDVYDASQGTALGRTVSLPGDGRELFVTLRTRRDGVWASSRTTVFATGNGAPAAAQITSPADHSSLGGASETFTWEAGSGVSEYWLSVGTTITAMDVFSASQGNRRSAVVALPTDGSPLYVTLFSLINGTWHSNQYLYDAAASE